MKFINSIIVTVITFFSINAVAAPPTIETKILEVQLWGEQYFFRIENPDLINPANCVEDEWVVTNGGGGVTQRRDLIQVQQLVERLIHARETDSVITIAIGETFCGLNSPDSGQSQPDRFPVVRAVFF